MGIMFKNNDPEEQPRSPAAQKKPEKFVQLLERDIDGQFVRTHPDADTLKKLLDMREHILSQNYINKGE
jgi:hypothetical protein